MKYLFFYCFATLAIEAKSQEIAIRGIVYDQTTGKGISSASISIFAKTSAYKGNSDFNGAFEIRTGYQFKKGDTFNIRIIKSGYSSKMEKIKLNLLELVLIQLKPLKPRKAFPPKYEMRLVNQDALGNVLKENFSIETTNMDGVPGGRVVVREFRLTDTSGYINRIERKCSAQSNGCLFNYRIHDKPSKEGCDEFPSAGEAGQYWPDCHIFGNKKGFTYYRRWAGKPCAETYTVYYQKLKPVCVENCNSL